MMKIINGLMFTGKIIFPTMQGRIHKHITRKIERKYELPFVVENLMYFDVIIETAQDNIFENRHRMDKL